MINIFRVLKYNYFPFIPSLILHIVTLTYHVFTENHTVNQLKSVKSVFFWKKYIFFKKERYIFFLGQIQIWDLFTQVLLMSSKRSLFTVDCG